MMKTNYLGTIKLDELEQQFSEREQKLVQNDEVKKK